MRAHTQPVQTNIGNVPLCGGGNLFRRQRPVGFDEGGAYDIPVGGIPCCDTVHRRFESEPGRCLELRGSVRMTINDTGSLSVLRGVERTLGS